MVSTGEEQGAEEIQVELGDNMTPSSYKVKKDKVPLQISTSQKGLLGHENHRKGFLLDVFRSHRSRTGFQKFDSSDHSLASPPPGKFQQMAEERDESSRSAPSSTNQGFRERFSASFARKMKWDYLKKMSKDWLRSPMNMALLVWIICVAVSGAILFMVMIGMLNHVIPKKTQRNAWFEVNNQILNALFTLMCLYQHPKRFHHLVLLCKWRPGDVSYLRNIYCKNGTQKPNEWAHMMVVVVLLHLNCFAQYALCGLNLGYKRSRRPAGGVGICLTVAIGAAAVAGLYTSLSPLGRDYESETDPEAQDQMISSDVNRQNYLRGQSLEKKFSFALQDNQRVVENSPKWRGGLFDIWDDISLAYLSLFCSFCVFGWNMDRLGFGNMYVHIATFLLFCLAPFWIFNLAAVNIDNDVVRTALGVTGIVLCIFGLLYGGFWRIQMRRRFNLPADYCCCGSPAMTDCVQWLFCCWCSLSQEVRTGDFYDIVEDKFYLKQSNDNNRPVLSPLPREDGSVQMRISQGSPIWSSSSPQIWSGNPNGHLPILEEGSSTGGEDRTMTAPVPSLIRKEDGQPQ